MSIERINKFDIMRVAYAPSLAVLKENLVKLDDKELVMAELEKTLYIKFGTKLFKVALLEEVV